MGAGAIALRESTAIDFLSWKELIVGDLHIVPSEMRVMWKGHRVYLSATHMYLLYLIADKPAMVKSREWLDDLLEGEGAGRMTYNYIRKLRDKFREVDPDWHHIETHTGVGYSWTNGEAVYRRSSRNTPRRSVKSP